MARLIIENVPDDLYERLKRQAEAHRRGLDREVIDRLERSVLADEGEDEPIDVEAEIAEIEALNARLKLPPLTDEFLREAKNWGRE